MEQPKPLTFGQRAVRVSFNPSGLPGVDETKQKIADLIDYFHDLRNQPTTSHELAYQCGQTITRLRDACMWGVGAVTWKD